MLLLKTKITQAVAIYQKVANSICIGKCKKAKAKVEVKIIIITM